MVEQERKVTRPVQMRIENGEVIRASGDVRCKHCNFPYYDHDQVAPGFTVILCNGKLMKL